MGWGESSACMLLPAFKDRPTSSKVFIEEAVVATIVVVAVVVVGVLVDTIRAALRNPCDQSVHQSIDPSIDQSIRPSINRPSKQPYGQNDRLISYLRTDHLLLTTSRRPARPNDAPNPCAPRRIYPLPRRKNKISSNAGSVERTINNKARVSSHQAHRNTALA